MATNDDPAAPRFEFARQGSAVTYAVKLDGEVRVFRAIDGQDGATEIARWNASDLRELAIWAGDDLSVTYSITGPLAKQVTTLAKELSLAPEMFVWHAVKIFIDTADAS